MIDAVIADERGVLVVAVSDLNGVVGAVVLLRRLLHLTVDVREHQVDAIAFNSINSINSFINYYHSFDLIKSIHSLLLIYLIESIYSNQSIH